MAPSRPRAMAAASSSRRPPRNVPYRTVDPRPWTGGAAWRERAAATPENGPAAAAPAMMRVIIARRRISALRRHCRPAVYGLRRGVRGWLGRRRGPAPDSAGRGAEGQRAEAALARDLAGPHGHD